MTVSDNKNPLLQDDEYMDTVGANLLLCVACLTDDDIGHEYQAIVIYQGHSLCREHVRTWNTFGIHSISSTNG